MKTRLALALLAAGAIAALGSWAADEKRPALAAPPGSVAVLPFDAPDDLHDGVKHILAGWLKEIPYGVLQGPARLYVARPGAVPAKPPADPLASGRALRVSSVLVGKVAPSEDGSKLTVEAELLHVETGLLMWRLDWEVSDILRKVESLDKARDYIIQGVRERLDLEVSPRQPRK